MKLRKLLSAPTAFFICTTLLMGSCRFGNHVEYSSDPNKGLQVKFYETLPQSVRICAAIRSPSSGELIDTCKEVGTNFVPADVADAMTNPVALVLTDAATQRYALARADTKGNVYKYNLPILGNDNGDLLFLATAAPAALYLNDECKIDLTLDESGKRVASSGPWTSGANIPLSGRIELLVRVTRKLSGKCDQTLSEMLACYNQVEDCGTGDADENRVLQDYVISVFDQYIQAGAMLASDLPFLETLSYEVSYQ